MDIVSTLLDHGADPTAKTSRGKTPCDIASRNGDYMITPILRKAQLAHELIQAGGEAKRADTIAIRFGGPPGAGKTTLAEALQVSRLRSILRSENQVDDGAANMQQRTKGINCHTFMDDNSLYFTIFDLGGHGEFLTSHQMFIGDGTVPVVDCVVVSVLDNSLEENALKWCSLFASRNQPTLTPWPLLLIATRADKLRDSEKQKGTAFAAYHKIKQTFGDYFCFPLEEPLFVDARKSWSDLTILLRHTLSTLHGQLISGNTSVRQPAICQAIIEQLPRMQQQLGVPVVFKDTFIEFMRPHIGLTDSVQAKYCKSKLESLVDKALQFLTGYAKVLTFQVPLAEKYVVISPSWLLSDVVGRLMAERPLPGPFVHYDNGYAKKVDVVAALQTEHLPGEDAFEMVADLGFCLEQATLAKVLNPSKLLGYRRDECWRRDPTMTVNAGRRLKCKGTVAIAHAFHTSKFTSTTAT